MKLVYGVGINDADYSVTTAKEGKRVMCPMYQRWANMLQRCYDPKKHEKQPTYIGCQVDEEWHKFSSFREWLIKQNNWENLQIDKDLMIRGNKVYSPDTCLVVDSEVNMFTNERTRGRGKLLIGVTVGRRGKGYRASLGQMYIAQFDSEIDAHNAWWSAKCEKAKELASRQNDKRVSEALTRRYQGMSPFIKNVSQLYIDRTACLKV